MSALSGTVTSSSNTAPSLQDALSTAETVPPGVDVVDASSVPVGGICVGTDKPAFVGGRVEVTKRGGVSVTVSCETLTHELRARLAMRINVAKVVRKRFAFLNQTCGTVFSLWCCKDDNIVSIVIEERVSHTDIDKGITDHVQVVAYIARVVLPPIHRALTG